MIPPSIDCRRKNHTLCCPARPCWLVREQNLVSPVLNFESPVLDFDSPVFLV